MSEEFLIGYFGGALTAIACVHFGFIVGFLTLVIYTVAIGAIRSWWRRKNE